MTFVHDNSNRGVIMVSRPDVIGFMSRADEHEAAVYILMVSKHSFPKFFIWSRYDCVVVDRQPQRTIGK